MMGPLHRRMLDELVFKLSEIGVYAGRHSYSYRLMYKGRIIAGIHVYPLYNTISVRLYKAFKDLVNEVGEKITNTLSYVFKDYRIIVEWYPK